MGLWISVLGREAKPEMDDWRQISNVRNSPKIEEERTGIRSSQTSLLHEWRGKACYGSLFSLASNEIVKVCEYNGTNFPKKEKLSLKKLPQIFSKEVPLYW